MLPLCSIAVISEGKYAILTPEVLDRLVELLNVEDSELRLNSIKLLSLLAETPKGKESLKATLGKVSCNTSMIILIMVLHTIQLEELAVQDTSDMVRKTAHIATRIIKWVP